MKRTLIVVVLLAACGGAGRQTTPRSNRDVITREQIDQAQTSDAYILIQRLRPDYLRPRGGPSINRGAPLAVVYVDGVRRGDPGVLRNIRPDDVQEIRFHSSSDATTRWGTDHAGGVIEVLTRR